MSSLGEQDDVAAAYGNLTRERAYWQFKSDELADWILSRRPPVRRAMAVLSVRCPALGCLLGQVYRFDMRPEPVPESHREMLRALGREASQWLVPNRFIWIGVSRGNARKTGILNWAFSDDWRGPKWYVPTGCGHGAGRIVLAWALECVSLVEGWHHALETVEHARAQAPEELQRSIARRTFHPDRATWRVASSDRSSTRVE